MCDIKYTPLTIAIAYIKTPTQKNRIWNLMAFNI